MIRAGAKPMYRVTFEENGRTRTQTYYSSTAALSAADLHRRRGQPAVAYHRDEPRPPLVQPRNEP